MMLQVLQLMMLVAVVVLVLLALIFDILSSRNCLTVYKKLACL